MLLHLEMHQVLRRYAVINAVLIWMGRARTFVEPTRISTKKGMYLSNATARNRICLVHFALSTPSRARVVSSVSTLM